MAARLFWVRRRTISSCWAASRASAWSLKPLSVAIMVSRSASRCLSVVTSSLRRAIWASRRSGTSPACWRSWSRAGRRRQRRRHAHPREAQISRLKAEAITLRERLARQDTTITEFTGFKAHALSRIAAQHDEITRLRDDIQRAASFRRLPAPVPRSPGASPVKEPSLP